jgi:hypothetical protein
MDAELLKALENVSARRKKLVYRQDQLDFALGPRWDDLFAQLDDLAVAVLGLGRALRELEDQNGGHDLD